MKSLAEINETLAEFERRHNIQVIDAQQGSGMWHFIKLGVISASNANKVVAKRDSDTRLTYMSELAAQVCTGAMEELSNKYLDWGTQHEPAARSWYEFESGNKITQLPFVFKDTTFREGCSPDGIVSDTKGIEIKCPFNAVHFVKFLAEDVIKPEYQWQCQYTLRVMGADEWDFAQFHPLMKKTPMKTITIERDLEKQRLFDDAVPQFIHDMDKMLEKIGVPFGEQWARGMAVTE